MSNPFEKDPQSQNKNYFGTLSLITNKVDLVSGAGFVVDGITNRDGSPREFKGKMKSDKGKSTHVIAKIVCRNQAGEDYAAVRDFMYWQTDVAQKVTMPSLRKHFGEKLEGIWDKTAEVQAEVVTIEDGDYDRQAFRIVQVFKTREEREEAEQAFFAGLQQSADDIADEMGFEDEPLPWDEPEEVGMPKEQALALLPTIWEASQKDKDKFLKTLEGMEAVVSALGGTDAPEIKALIEG